MVLEGAIERKPDMGNPHKYEKPADPFTPAVLTDIEAKTNIVLRKFKDFGNAERHEERAAEVKAKCGAEIMNAYARFVPNDKCSWDAYASICLRSVQARCIHDFGKRIEKERATVYGDNPLPGGDEDSDTFFGKMREARESAQFMADAFDFEEVIALLQPRYPVCVAILRLRREGYEIQEIAEKLGKKPTRIYNYLWPKAKRLYLKVSEFMREVE